MMSRFHRPGFLLLLNSAVLGSIFAFSGCDNQQIVEHKNVGSTREIGMKLGSPRDLGEKSRMVVTIYEHANTLWMFKIVGAVSAVKNEERWRPFVDSIQFGDDGKPQWTLPDGWSEGPPSQFVYSKISIPGDPPLEISVSDLPAGQDLAANVNRWRGQLSLPPMTDSIDNHLTKRKVNTVGNEQTLVVYDETGHFGGGMSPQQPALPQFIPGKIDFDIPDDWSVVKTSSALTNKFEKVDGDKKVDISITQLPNDRIGWSQVANMWGSQLNLEEMDDEGLDKVTQALKTEHLEALRIRMDSTKDSSTAKITSILGVMFKDDQRAWFVKMIGDQELVDSEEEAFIKMIESIKFVNL